MRGLLDTKKHLVGQTFGRLTVTGDTGRLSPRKETLWACNCTCGGTADVPTSSLTRGFKKSCGCLRGRKVTTDHNNRDCREAVRLALYLARRWGKELFIHFGHKTCRYVIHGYPPGKGKRPEGRGRVTTQTAYRVTPTGEVIPTAGYPSLEALFPAAEGQR